MKKILKILILSVLTISSVLAEDGGKEEPPFYTENDGIVLFKSAEDFKK